jgi:large subunit ribosomal protein L29
MKKKQLQELKSKPKEELQKMLLDLRAKVWQYKQDLASGKVKNIKEIRATKKDIARILTISSGMDPVRSTREH